MFNLGFTEILFISVLALVLIGPKQLPEVARTLGRFLNELKRSTDAIKDEFKDAAFKDEDLRNLYQPLIGNEPIEDQKLHGGTIEDESLQHENEQQLELTAQDDKKDERNKA